MDKRSTKRTTGFDVNEFTTRRHLQKNVSDPTMKDVETSKQHSRSLSPLNKKKGKAWKRLLKRHRYQVDETVGEGRNSTSSAPNSPSNGEEPSPDHAGPVTETKFIQQVISSESLISSSNHYDDTQEEDGDDVTIDGQGSHHSTDSNEVRKVALVWKKKSGLSRKIKKGYALASEGANFLMVKSHLTKSNKDGTSKYTGASNGRVMWERRKLVLDNTMLMYFDINADVEDVSVLEDANITLLERMKHKLKWIEPVVNDDNNTDHASCSAINTPRSAIDLLATHATAYYVSTESYHSPTPYVLHIVTKYESKWAVCFETPDELLNWLKILSNVTLRQSEATYKLGHGAAYCSITSHEEREAGLAQTPLKQVTDDIEQAEDSDDLNRKKSDNMISITPLKSSLVPKGGGYRFALLVNVPICYICFLTLTMPVLIKSIFALFIANVAIYLGNYHNLEKSNVRGISDDMVSAQSTVTSFDQNMSSPSPFGTIHTKSLSETKTASFKQPFQLTPRSKRNMESTKSFVTSIKNLVIANDSDQASIFKPIAGSTTIKLNSPSETVLGKIGWVSKPPSSVAVRGANYLSDKKKVPSPGSLYELVQVDVFDADTYITEIAHKVKLPESNFESKSEQWLAPDILVVSFALPTAIPKLGRTSTDLRGIIVTGYYRMRNETRKVLSIITNPEIDSSLEEDQVRNEVGGDYQRIISGVRLWETWCREAPSNPEMQKRLKFIPKGDNLSELKVPNWICKYNGKPMLMKRPGVTGFVYPYSGENILEIGISLHPFPYMFKQAMTYLKDSYFPKMLMTFSFVIEGRNEKELPEVLLGNPILLPFIDPESILHADDVFQMG